jgi:DNA (cytosine-5)-methyltransferase 1
MTSYAGLKANGATTMADAHSIPVIDVFAGPGGLGEGFSAYRSHGHRAFKIALSIEMDAVAHQTLELRAFFRQFVKLKDVPEAYYEHLRNPYRSETERRQLLRCDAGELAQKEVWHATLGIESLPNVRAKIENALQNSGTPWILIGGPPCQAYSMVGRARNRGRKNYRLEDDPKHGLYKHYLQIIADYRPAVFVMENVKGLLSARAAGESVFQRMREDLQHPSNAIRANGGRPLHRFDDEYEIRSFVVAADSNASLGVPDFIIHAERYGIPQARHRVILMGVRSDFADRDHNLLQSSKGITIEKVLSDLPRVRSGVSRGNDSDDLWRTALDNARLEPWFTELIRMDPAVAHAMLSQIGKLTVPRKGLGSEFLPTSEQIAYEPDWFQPDRDRLGGVCNHIARTHMRSDLHRYLFAAIFGRVYGYSPQMADFPTKLRPLHGNVEKALDGRNFADRFRVQVKGRPSTTVTSHICKDGHYYIHFDPLQCRSFTVREAARLQTFPDNYLFCGNRTQQYHQVGNAVPPLLARQIAQIVYDLIKRKTNGRIKQRSSKLEYVAD